MDNTREESLRALHELIEKIAPQHVDIDAVLTLLRTALNLSVTSTNDLVNLASEEITEARAFLSNLKAPDIQKAIRPLLSKP